MTFLLLGLIGSGKTSVGVSLAQNLNFLFYEMDALAYEHTGVDNHNKISDSLWKECQLEISKDLSTQDNIVISCSGDMMENNLNLIYFKENAYNVKVIVLDADKKTLISRLENRGGKTDESEKIDNLEANIQQLINTRLPEYINNADFVIDTNKLNINEIVEKITQKYS